jgi:glycosyltransferase involved in cell wall biosynthesis
MAAPCTMEIMETQYKNPKKVTVAIVTCYFLPDYVRSISLRAALSSLPGVETIIIKNSATGILRYPEVAFKMIWCRLTRRPDVYMLGFRGQEMLPSSLLITLGKPLIFDEFIVPLAWATRENHAKTLRVRWFRLLARVSSPLYKRWLKACKFVLTDTKAHAELSAQLSRTPRNHYKVIPVGTDEQLFKPAPSKHPHSKDFRVFFYGLKMTPLHGLSYILEAAVKLGATHPHIIFGIIGGDQTTEDAVLVAKARGARINYMQFVPFKSFAGMMRDSDLCLGGPFGDTEQARSVVTGKTYQSLACAMPTVVANTAAYSAFTDEKDCLMVPLGDTNALVEKIIWAQAHPDKIAAIGAAGRKLYLETFSTEHIAAELQQIINEVI